MSAARPSVEGWTRGPTRLAGLLREASPQRGCVCRFRFPRHRPREGEVRPTPSDRFPGDATARQWRSNHRLGGMLGWTGTKDDGGVRKGGRGAHAFEAVTARPGGRRGRRGRGAIQGRLDGQGREEEDLQSRRRVRIASARRALSKPGMVRASRPSHSDRGSRWSGGPLDERHRRGWRAEMGVLGGKDRLSMARKSPRPGRRGLGETGRAAAPSARAR